MPQDDPGLLSPLYNPTAKAPVQARIGLKPGQIIVFGAWEAPIAWVRRGWLARRVIRGSNYGNPYQQ
jgi:hypothetical protein